VIAWLRGICQSTEDDHIVLDVQGVGYRVFVSDRDRAGFRIGVSAEVSIHMTVREDAMLLYGFATPAGREVFRALVSVPGLGPKGAMSLLSTLSLAEIAAAVAVNRVTDLMRAKGIGKRLAETIVVKLRDRLDVSLPALELAVAGAPPSADAVARDVLSALANLGYKPAAAESVLADVRKANPQASFDDLMRAALGQLRRPAAS
jgi:Holliday junction DNA helicase RuvA